LGVIRKHGIRVEASADYSEFKIYGRQVYIPYNHRVIGDFSSAAFLLAAAVVTNSHIRVENLEAKLKEQPDVEILNVLDRMGVKLRVEENAVEVSSGRMRGLEIDVEDTPDLVPVYAALGCFAEGETRIVNAGRLRIKESDRLEALAAELGKMGAAVNTTRDVLMVRGRCALKGARITPHNDHRIAMACAVVALGARGETVITDAECVNKSYPNFFNDLKRLGGRVTYAS
jgi:3-phosphoshikimate 1-carboxyvinyltransferase